MEERLYIRGPILVIALFAFLFFVNPTLTQAQRWQNPALYGGYFDDEYYDDDWYYDYYDYQGGYSDFWIDEQSTLQRSLPSGKERSFYRKQLRGLGYEITAVNENDEDYIEYEVVKGPLTYEIQIELDEDTGRATEVEVAANTWRADATEQALESTSSPEEWDD